MSPSLLSFVENMNEFKLRQTLGVSDDPSQKLLKHIGHDAPYEYEIQNQEGEIIGMAQEEKKESLMPFWVKNYYLKGRRAITIKVTNENYDVIMYLKRSAYILTSTTLLYDENREMFAVVKRRFHPFIKKYELLTQNRELIGFIHAPITKIWTFPVYNPRKREIGKIKKRFPTVGEFLTYRETFKAQCDKMSPEEKVMTLSASIILSIEHFS